MSPRRSGNGRTIADIAPEIAANVLAIGWRSHPSHYVVGPYCWRQAERLLGRCISTDESYLLRDYVQAELAAVSP